VRAIRPARPAPARWCAQTCGSCRSVVSLVSGKNRASPAAVRSYFILAMDRDRTDGFSAIFGALMLFFAHGPERSEAVSAYAESLPPQERGALILVLLVNAILTLALEAVQLALVVRTLRRAAKAEDPVETILGCAISPSTATAVGASALHKLARERFLRRLDQRVRAAETTDHTR
jgi:hypothetical protein